MEKKLTVKTTELRGRALAWAVAQALHYEPLLLGQDDGSYAVIAHFKRGAGRGLGLFGPFDPTSDWLQGGPLLQQNGITVGATDETDPETQKSTARTVIPLLVSYGNDYLEAGMRHLVRVRLGETADVPVLLLPTA